MKSNEDTEECSRHHHPCYDTAVVILLSVIQTTDWGGTPGLLGHSITTLYELLS